MPTQTSTITGVVQAILFPPFGTQLAAPALVFRDFRSRAKGGRFKLGESIIMNNPAAQIPMRRDASGMYLDSERCGC
jgi:hypothetical protein